MLRQIKAITFVQQGIEIREHTIRDNVLFFCGVIGKIEVISSPLQKEA